MGFKKLIIVAVVAGAFATSASATDTFYLDSTNPNNGVTLALAAGAYQIAYNGGAWNPWGQTPTGCDTNHHCAGVGWYNAFSYSASSGSATFWDGIRWETAALSAASAQTSSPFTFTLAHADNVKFYIGDNPYYDNTGGINLSVTAVPEPETFAMLLAGLGLMGAVARRRKANQT